jgi:hypothetical protein
MAPQVDSAGPSCVYVGRITAGGSHCQCLLQHTLQVSLWGGELWGTVLPEEAGDRGAKEVQGVRRLLTCTYVCVLVVFGCE